MPLYEDASPEPEARQKAYSKGQLLLVQAESGETRELWLHVLTA